MAIRAQPLGYLEERGQDFDSSSSEEDIFNLVSALDRKRGKLYKKKKVTLPRAEWLRYCAYKFGDGEAGEDVMPAEAVAKVVVFFTIREPR